MKLARLLLIALVFPGFSRLTFAFDRCEAVSSSPDALIRQIGDTGLARSPVKYHALAQSIKLLAKGPEETLIPFAADQQGKKVIIFPPLFASVVCKLALAQFLVMEGALPGTFDQVAANAAKCFDSGGSQKTCLVGFANELAVRYDKAFRGLSADAQGVAMGLYTAALYQIAMHEYAHHFLDHFARIRTKKLARIDAEFEADLFAISNGVQAGEAESAMYYFFEGVAEIERYTKRLATNDYESGACRASNVNNITAFLGISPIVLIDASFGGRYSLARNSPSFVRSLAKKQFAGGPPALRPGSCGRIATVALGETFQEVKRLYLRMEPEADFLFAKESNPSVERASRLLRDLSRMCEEFQYINNVAAKCITLFLRRWGLRGQSLTLLIDQANRLLDSESVTQNFLSEDFGRVLQAQGLGILQERKDLTANVRLDRSFSLFQRAVIYNPAQAETWSNLAFIAFIRGDCGTAARFADSAVATLAPDAPAKDRESTVFFSKAMKQMSSKPETCKAAGMRFHPYPGL